MLGHLGQLSHASSLPFPNFFVGILGIEGVCVDQSDSIIGSDSLWWRNWVEFDVSTEGERAEVEGLTRYRLDLLHW